MSQKECSQEDEGLGVLAKPGVRPLPNWAAESMELSGNQGSYD